MDVPHCLFGQQNVDVYRDSIALVGTMPRKPAVPEKRSPKQPLKPACRSGSAFSVGLQGLDSAL